MLLYEQYFMIYLLGIFLLPNKDLKILFLFIVVDYILDNIFYSILHSPTEYIITITVVELISLLFILPLVKNIKIRILFSLCYSLTMINPYFILGIDYFISRNDNLSYLIYVLCENSSRYANEIFIFFLTCILNKKETKTNFWLTFTAFNYVLVLANQIKEI